MVSQQILIRQAQEADLEAIYRINLTWGEASMAYLLEQRYGPIGDEPAAVFKARTMDETCRRHLEDLLVAEVDGQVAGYALVLVDERRKVGTVGENAVDPAFRGHGIGTALQRRVQQVFRERGMRYAHVTTMVHDHPARRVYEKMGFEEYARSIHYFMELDGDGATGRCASGGSASGSAGIQGPGEHGKGETP